MRHLHELAMVAINAGCVVVTTNMVRNAPATMVDQTGRNIAQAVIPSHQREYLGSSVSIYSHVKLKLEIANASRSSFRAKLVQPAGREPVSFAITHRGVADVD
jgi:hypothetical protein